MALQRSSVPPDFAEISSSDVILERHTWRRLCAHQFKMAAGGRSAPYVPDWEAAEAGAIFIDLGLHSSDSKYESVASSASSWPFWGEA